jgi:hypothetical protein
MEEEAIAKAEAAGAGKEVMRSISYSLYCSSDPDFVRQHLDSGVLAKMIKEKEAKFYEPPEMFRDPVYLYVLLGACAMTLGCQLPDPYMAMLKKVYTEGGLMPDALKQMRKALFGPEGYKNGVLYDFESKGLLETANSMDDVPQSKQSRGYIGMNVMSPGGFSNTGMGDSSTSVVIQELRAKHDKPNACGGCGKERTADGESLLRCARCKDRNYCGVACQKQHWKVHKKVCDLIKK